VSNDIDDQPVEEESEIHERHRHVAADEAVGTVAADDVPSGDLASFALGTLDLELNSVM
jgi:hypothetical protein